MDRLREFLDRQAPHFEKGAPLERLYPAFEALDSFLYTPGSVTRTGSHVRDGLDLKRIMSIVVVALLPTVFMAMWNTGYQACNVIAQGASPLPGWQASLFTALGFSFDPESAVACIVLGALYFVPVLVVSYLAGALVEIGSAMIRGHDVNEGYLVTGMLIPLTLPPTIPLWLVAIGAMFGVIFAKEVFGGTGMNFLNPALTARAFLFFAYPAQLSGTAPWIAADFMHVDGFAGATWLAQAAETAGALDGVAWMQAFLGWIPGSMGETSALACLVGAVLLVATGIGSWRTMAGVVLGTFLLCGLLNWAGSETNPMFAVPFHWHVVLGGWAFGMVYMATDPVSSAFTDRGKWLYGAGIGVLCILVRVVNPAYPEGMMLAILFMNMFAPLIDHFVVRANVKRRLARSVA